MLVGLALSGKAGRSSANTPEYSAEESLDELAVLARSAGAEVVERILQIRPGRTAATLIGSGKVEEIAARVKGYSAQTVVFDEELTPTQLRNLERELDCKVLDRTQLILDIFARRARTREGQLQVELAQLNYLLPRLTGRGAQMSRLGGGIGTRGPGETQLETDRRKIARRIKKIEDDLENVRAGRKVQRAKRQAVPLETVALVGYTNAGKSTLFNRLTGAGVVADARMFATLDPTVRQIVLPSNRRALLSDTVGFIRNLPTTLVRAFRATLEEVVEASLLLHVVDAGSPHAGEQTSHVLKVLAEIGAGKTPQLLVLNKLDQLSGEQGDPATIGRRLLGESETHEPLRAAGVSALQGHGLDKLMAAIDEGLPKDPVSSARFRFPLSQGAPLSFLHDYARVTATRYTADACEVEAEVPDSVRRRLAQYVVE
ncbi:MAG TPA: GTPase HflX [Solibacterales bacterium]|nr:GTPase HflX [Bryobacterales bacterium]